MVAVSIEWAGELRAFDLPLGKVMDIEEACGKTGIGTVFSRVASGSYFANDLYQIIRAGLIGGGMAVVEVDRILQARFITAPLIETQSVCVEIMSALVVGIVPEETKSDGGAPEAIDVGALLHSFLQAGISPDQVRAMGYADFVNIIRASGSKKDEPNLPTEEEYLAAIRAKGFEI